MVIDDGSHRLEDQQASINALWPQLKELGVYLIEDIHNWDTPVAMPGACAAYYPWVAVFQKWETCIPQRIVTGHPSRPLNPDELAAYGALDAKYLQNPK